MHAPLPLTRRGEEEEEKKEDEIRTTIESSALMQQSCTRGSRQLFLSCAQGGVEGVG